MPSRLGEMEKIGCRFGGRWFYVILREGCSLSA